MNKQQTRGKRGVILTNQGFKRLQDAQQESENTDNYGVPLTIEALSDRTHLDPGTVSKVLHREVTVDKRTLERFFRTFGLELSKADYQKPDTVTNNSQEFTRYEQSQNWGNAPEEKSLLYWLAINRESIDLKQIQSDIILPLNEFNLLEVIESLHRRSLIEKNKFRDSTSHSKFTLQPVVMEYMTMKLIDIISEEISSGDILLFQSHALVKATAPEYIQDIQNRLILKPIINNLSLLVGHSNQIEAKLLIILNNLRGKSPYITGYVAGNTINLLGQIFPKISNQDFSNLTIWQANLQNITLNKIDFSNSNFQKSTFVETFGIIFGLAFSCDERLLATGGIDGNVWIWNLQDNQQLFKQKAHNTIVEFVVFSPDCQKLATSSRDKTVKIWDIKTNQCLLTLQSPDKLPVKNIIFNQDGNHLFGFTEKKILCWDIQTANCKIFISTNSRISSIALSSHQLLAFGSIDGVVSIWDITTGNCVKNLQTNSGVILSVVFTKDGKILASSVLDKTVKIWHVNTDKCIQIEARSQISLTFISSDGKNLAISSKEKTVQIFNIESGKYIQTLEGHLLEINALAFSPKGQIATTSVDRTVKLWNTSNGKCLKTLYGRTDFVHSIVFSNNQTPCF
jgi:WD40 repeat protein